MNNILKLYSKWLPFMIIIAILCIHITIMKEITYEIKALRYINITNII